jgi:glucosamine-6-phosphate deaminase
MSITVHTWPTPEEVGVAAADTIADLIEENPHAVIGLATGSTPIETYRLLAERHRHGLSFSQITTFNLDEYVGLSPEHPKSYHCYMDDHLFSQIDVDRSRTHIPKGDVEDVNLEGERFERKITNAEGVDIWLLGIGPNGHIAFNEPGCARDSRTRVVQLANETITANSRFFDSPDEVPRFAITAGIDTIMAADRILLLAYGSNKAKAVAEAVTGPTSPDCPASFLQEHLDCTFLLDDSAASLLEP